MTALHVNGWPRIEEHLRRTGRTQCDLARVLHITPPAISQFKKGRACFNPHQLDSIVRFLDFDDKELDGFYSDLFNARLIGGEGSAIKSGKVALNGGGLRSASIPVCKLSRLYGYEPALESIDRFAARNECGRLLFERGGAVCAFSDETDKLHPMVVVDGAAYMEKDGLALLALRDGKITVLHCKPGAGGSWRFFDRDSDRYCFDWHPELAPGLVRWMHPAVAIQ